MRKADLVTAISEKTGVPKVDVLVTLETLFKEVKSSLAEGDKDGNLTAGYFNDLSPVFGEGSLNLNLILHSLNSY